MPRADRLTAPDVARAIREYGTPDAPGLSLRDLAARYGVERSTIRYHLVRRGVRLRPRGSTLTDPRVPAWRPRVSVHLYVAHQLSIPEAARLIGCCPDSVFRDLKREDVRRRRVGRWNTTEPTCECDMPERLARQGSGPRRQEDTSEAREMGM